MRISTHYVESGSLRKAIVAEGAKSAALAFLNSLACGTKLGRLIGVSDLPFDHKDHKMIFMASTESLLNETNNHQQSALCNT